MASGTAGLAFTPLLGNLSGSTVDYATSGTSQPINLLHISKPTVYVRSSGGTISAGTLLIEEADWHESQESTYSATWFTIATIDLTALSGTAQQIAEHLGGPGGAFGYSNIRARLSVAVVGAGGGVLVTLRGIQ